MPRRVYSRTRLDKKVARGQGKPAVQAKDRCEKHLISAQPSFPYWLDPSHTRYLNQDAELQHSCF